MPDQYDDSTSQLEDWIIGSRKGDNTSLNRIAEYLLPKAFEYANRNMLNLSPMDDYEDVALSAVKSVCLRLREGRAEFLGEKELGGLLRQFVVRKIRDRQKYHFREKRNVNQTVGENSLDPNKNGSALQEHAAEDAKSVWLDDQSVNLSIQEQEYLKEMLDDLGTDVQGLFSELVKRLDENPRKVLMLITTGKMSNGQLADALDCAPTSIERYRQAIRRKLEEIVNE